MSTGSGADAAATHCRSCGAALAAGQRYCLECGDRQGSHRVESGPVLSAIAAASAAAAASGEEPPREVEPEVAGDPDPSIAASLATKPAASAGLALLVVGAVAGAAFSPSAVNSVAAQQRVVIVQAAGAPATGPLAEEPFDDGSVPVVEEPALPAEPLPVDPPYTPPPAPKPTPDPPPTDPSIGHMAFVMLPGGAAGQAVAASARSSAAKSGSASSSEWSAAFSGIRSKGFSLRGFRQVAATGIGNYFALFTGAQPTVDMNSGCSWPLPEVEPARGCIVARGLDDLITLTTQQLASQSQALRVYVETPAREDGDYRHLCRIPRPGDEPDTPTDGTPPSIDNPVLWFRQLSGEPDGESGLCHSASSEGSVRPLSMMEDDLRRAAAEDSENFDPTIPSAFPKITLIVPSRCRVDASVKCPDGSDGGPEALKRLLDGPVATTLASSDVFGKDGAVVAAWDRPASGSTSPTGAVVLSPFVKAGGSNSVAYDTWSLLATVQRRFGLAGDTGQAPLLGRSANAKAIGSEVFPRR